MSNKITHRFHSKPLKIGDIIHYHNSWYVTYELIIDIEFPRLTTLTICADESIPYADYNGQIRSIHKNDCSILKAEENELMEILYGK